MSSSAGSLQCQKRHQHHSDLHPLYTPKNNNTSRSPPIKTVSIRPIHVWPDVAAHHLLITTTWDTQWAATHHPSLSSRRRDLSTSLLPMGRAGLTQSSTRDKARLAQNELETRRRGASAQAAFSVETCIKRRDAQVAIVPAWPAPAVNIEAAWRVGGRNAATR